MSTFTLPPTFNAGVNYYPSSPATVDGNRNRFIDASIWVQMWPDIGEASMSYDSFTNQGGDVSYVWPGTEDYPEFDPYSTHNENSYTAEYSGSTDYRKITTDPSPPTLDEQIVCTGTPTLGPLFATLSVTILGTGTSTHVESLTYTPDPGGGSYSSTTVDTDPTGIGFAVARYNPTGDDLADYIALGISEPEAELWVISSGAAVEQQAWSNFDAGGSGAPAYSFSAPYESPGTPDIVSWDVNEETEITASVSWS